MGQSSYSSIWSCKPSEGDGVPKIFVDSEVETMLKEQRIVFP